MFTKLTSNRPKLIQWAMIAVLLFLCTAFVYTSPAPNVLLVLIALAPAIAAFLFGLAYPHIGTIGLVAAALVLPVEIGTGTESSINAAFLLLLAQLGFWILRILLVERDFKLIQERTVYASIIFIIVSIFGFLAGQYQWYPVNGAGIAPQIGGLLMFVLSAGALLLIGHQLSQRHLQMMVTLFLGLGFVYMVARAVPPIGQLLLTAFMPGSTGSMFWVWLGALGFSQAFFNDRLAMRWRIVCGVLVGMMLFIALGSARTWSSGWLPLVATIGSMTMFYIARLRPRLLLLLLPLMVVGLLGVLANSAQTVDSVTDFSNESYSLLTRLDAYEIVLQLAHKSPIFGLGPANYYFYTPLIPIRGYYVQFNSHSQIVDLIAQVGYVGLVVYLWLLLEVALMAWRLLPKAAEGFPKSYLLGSLGGVCGMVVSSILGDWVIPFVYNIGMTGFRASVLAWLFMGGVLVFGRIYGSTS